MIIAFSGKAHHGKDTAAEALIDRHKFIRIGLADKLKDITAKVFGLSRTDMDDPNQKEKIFHIPIRITPHHISDLFEILEDDGFVVTEDAYREVCHTFVGRPLTSIRHTLQLIGTDVIRNYVDDEVWLKYFEKATANTNANIVISDARFPNERKFLKDRGATLILIQREGLTSTDTHVSENLLGEEKEYDVVIQNNSTITGLHSSVSLWYTVKRDIFQG